MSQPARRLLLSVGLALSVALSGTTLPAPAQAAPSGWTQQPKYAAIVVDAKTGEVLYAKRADSQRYPASITKVMTLYLVMEQLASGKLKLDDRVVISPRAAAQSPTKLGLRPGDTISVDDAMKALATKSANDIAVALAEHVGGTEQRFAALMTLRAKELGMNNTHFANASGLPDSRQLTTARDLAILSRAVMRDYPQYYKLFSTRAFDFRGQTIRSHNRLLGRVPGVDGIKTGFTNASGYNIAVSGVQDGRRLITIVLGGPSGAARDNNAEDLMLTGFSVMRRRALGEQITVAQNLFEPEPSGPLTRPSVEQGDTDQDGLRIELASATPQPARATAKPAKKKEAEKPAAAAKGKWTVQVGAFKSKSDAREQLALVKKRYGAPFTSANGVTDAGGGKHRAQFTGMTEANAKAACRELKAKKQPCLVIKPS
ncbi:D-alanyl-D-alanine carboxypeptidase [Phenylobacterium sp.]|jgi:D-alanyl-D-alanine carboxypeptidase (penicillin-binding protein 5/6)|uniref:D-alanyl-D-alanine carboxypeptidase n=1 Tax=Phenylobacterium sp. TaxID=1871053 RepID=UPI002E35137C|nr:D-alanyl-D-alanine carboxypeptidase [Phenylobacterium sp.]HEX2562113.1 D-alanyl-D-alanine carboxypeptidase [Phenylobacterium sp.]